MPVLPRRRPATSVSVKMSRSVPVSPAIGHKLQGRAVDFDKGTGFKTGPFIFQKNPSREIRQIRGEGEDTHLLHWWGPSDPKNVVGLKKNGHLKLTLLGLIRADTKVRKFLQLSEEELMGLYRKPYTDPK